MTDWYGNRRRERYTFRRVKWDWDGVKAGPDHFKEGTDYGNVTGGSVSLAAFTDAKASCSFDFIGGEPPDTTDLVRIYYSFEDDDGNEASIVLGTFFVEYGSTVYESANGGLIAKGTVEGTSVLAALLNRKLGAPYTVEAGEDAIAKANGIIKGLGLFTNDPDGSYIISAAHTFEPEDSYMTVVNWLLSSANYRAAYPNAKGTVIIAPAQSEGGVAVTFRDDERSIMLAEVTQENDWQATPNVARLNYESDDESLFAVAYNRSGNRASLDARGGRELTFAETVTELEGATQADRIAALKEMAKQRLLDQSTEIEKATLTHALIENMGPNVAVAIEYSGKRWSGNIVNMDISLEASTPCTTKLRRFISAALELDTEGGAIWTA